MPSAKAQQNFRDRVRLKQSEGGGYATRYCRQTLALRSMSETAEIMGLTRARVHQLERTAFHKIRMALLPIVKELNLELHAELMR